MVDIFHHVVSLYSKMTDILKPPRLFNPIHMAGDGISKKRWRKIGENNNYDKKSDSNDSQIQFFTGSPEDFKHSCNGNSATLNISPSDNTEGIEKHITWTAKQFKSRILKELDAKK